MKHIVYLSGGLASWCAAKRVAAQHGTKDLILLFTDTGWEDPDLYRFITEAAANVGGEFVRLADGRTPWEVFHNVRFLGNSRVDPCSRILKRELADKWISERFQPGECIRYFGFDWMEEHRLVRLRKRLPGWQCEAPLCAPPYLDKSAMMAYAKSEGLTPSRMYTLGFQHDNCGGRCVKQGQASWAHVLNVMPDRYMECEQKEQEFIQFIGSEVAMMKDRRNGGNRPLTLQEFRLRLQDGEEYDRFDYGSCSCFSEALPEDLI